MIGVTTEAIRFYEKKGILRNVRDDSSSYRFYTAEDIHMLLKSRVYSQLGLSLNEIAKLLENDPEDVAPFLGTIEKQRAALKKQLELDMRRLERVDDLEQFFHRISSQSHEQKFELCIQEGIYFLNNPDQGAKAPSAFVQSEFQKWANNAFFIFPAGRFSFENIQNWQYQMEWGIGVNEKYAAFLGIQQNDVVRYYPPRKCLHTILPITSFDQLKYSQIHSLLREAQNAHYELAGDITTYSILMTKSDNEYHSWHGIYIPVK